MSIILGYKGGHPKQFLMKGGGVVIFYRSFPSNPTSPHYPKKKTDPQFFLFSRIVNTLFDKIKAKQVIFHYLVTYTASDRKKPSLIRRKKRQSAHFNPDPKNISLDNDSLIMYSKCSHKKSNQSVQTLPLSSIFGCITSDQTFPEKLKEQTF